MSKLNRHVQYRGYCVELNSGLDQKVTRQDVLAE